MFSVYLWKFIFKEQQSLETYFQRFENTNPFSYTVVSLITQCKDEVYN